MPTKTKPKPIRRHVELTEQADQQLHQLQEMTGAASLSEVMRRALATYKLVVEHQNAGGDHEVIFRSGDRDQYLRIV